MIEYRNRHSIWCKAIVIGVVCLFLVNSISYAEPLTCKASKTTLAAESRLSLFFEKHGLDFRNIYTVISAARRLRKLIIDKHVEDVAIRREINRLNRIFPDRAVSIKEQIKTGTLQRDDGKKMREYTYAVFHFKECSGDEKVINVLFFTDHSQLTDYELRQLRITDAEKHHLDCPGLEGVWFINPAATQAKFTRETGQENKAPISIPQFLAMVDIAELPRYLRVDLLKQDKEEFKAIAENGSLPHEARDIMDHPETAQWPDTFNPKIACYLNAFFRGSWKKGGESRLQQFNGISEANFYDTVYGSLGNLYTWAAWQRAGLDPNTGTGKRLAAIYPSVQAAYARGPGDADQKDFIDKRDSFIGLLKRDTELRNAVLNLITSYQDISMDDYWYRTNFDWLLSGMGDQNEAEHTPNAILFSSNVLTELVEAGVITKSHFDKLDQERLKSYFYHLLGKILPYLLRAEFPDQSKVPDQKAKEIANEVFDHIEAINEDIESENKTIQWYVEQVHAILSAAKSQGILIANDIWAEFRQRVMEYNSAQDSNTAQLPPTATPVETSRQEAERIHAENLKYTPTIPEKTILCHIITDSILHETQKGMLQRLEQDMRGKKYSEKVARLSITDPDKFIDELRTLIAKQRELYKDYTVKFDVACPNTELVEEVLKSDLEVKALAFEPCKEPAQVEGIILALRALHMGRLDSLRVAFEILSGNKLDLEGLGITNIDEFARRITFILPAAKGLNYDNIKKLNDIIRKNIEAAA